jgi:hypothetical protein
MKTVTAVCTVILLAGLTVGCPNTKNTPGPGGQVHILEVDSPIVVVDGSIKINRPLKNVISSNNYKDSVTETGPDGKPNVAVFVWMFGNPYVPLPLPSDNQHPWTVNFYSVAAPTANDTPLVTISCSDPTGNKIDFYLPNFAYNSSDGKTENLNVSFKSATVDLGHGAQPTLLTCPASGPPCNVNIDYCEAAQCTK